jgi:hypothetical protein
VRRRRASRGAGARTVGARYVGNRSEARRTTAPAWNCCTEGRDLHRPDGLHPREFRSDGDIVASQGSARPTVRGPCTIGRTLFEGGARMLLPPACWRWRAEESRGVTIPGQPGLDVPDVWSSSAHSQYLMRCSRRSGGGNIIGSDVIWVDGCVQPAVAHAAVGVGVYVEAAERSG